MKKQKVKISERALLARINRKLIDRDELAKKCRSDSRWLNDLGDYYIVDVRNNVVLTKGVDLEALAKEEGLIKAYEELG